MAKKLPASESRTVTVKIKNWAAYKGRKDIEHNSWFRCSNRLLEDPDFFDFTSDELLVWIYILSLSSQKNTDVVCLNLAHAERVCRLKPVTVFSALEKLYENQIDPVDVTPTLRERHADVTQTCSTEQTEQTEQTNKHVTSADAFAKAFELYPVKIRGKDAERRFSDQITSLELEADLHRATRNYCAMLAIETWRYPKQTYAAFLGTKASGFFWRDFIDWTPEAQAAQKPQLVKPTDRFDSLATLVLSAIRKHAPGDESIAQAIGPDWDWLSRAGLMAHFRAMENNEFTKRNVAIELKAAYERMQVTA